MKLMKQIKRMHNNIRKIVHEIWEELIIKYELDDTIVMIYANPPVGLVHHIAELYDLNSGLSFADIDKKNLFDDIKNGFISRYGMVCKTSFVFDENDITVSSSSIIFVNHDHMIRKLYRFGKDIDIFKDDCIDEFEHELGHYFFNKSYIGKTKKEVYDDIDIHELHVDEYYATDKSSIDSFELEERYMNIPKEKEAEKFAGHTTESRREKWKLYQEIEDHSRFIVTDDDGDRVFIAFKYLSTIKNHITSLFFKKYEEYFKEIKQIEFEIIYDNESMELLYDDLIDPTSALSIENLMNFGEKMDNKYRGIIGLLFKLSDDGKLYIYIIMNVLVEIFLVIDTDGDKTCSRYKNYITRYIAKIIQSKKE